MKTAFRVGARGSRLSTVQTRSAISFLEREFPGTRYALETFGSPGDRDLATPIERSAPDFFTRDLDDAVRSGAIDFAVHSAKDLPSPVADDLDWFWLPEREDPCDCWVMRSDRTHLAKRKGFKIGISSDRRREYAARIYPKASLLPIRGSIDSRIQQLKDRKFDAVLMAAAGLNRLYEGREEELQGLDIIPISLSELAPPEAQGVLAVVFRRGNADVIRLRDRFVKAVRFVSAGVGDASLCTIAGMRDLAAADLVLYDDLMGQELVQPRPGCEFIPVGKRCGAHSLKQAEITRLICNEVRKGKRVVRLKGGDAGLFGRLAEEAEALESLGIPFVVRPGVSALTAATTGTGMLLTRRGESAGFAVKTPRRAVDDGTAPSVGERETLVMFMASKIANAEAAKLMDEGWPRSTPCAMAWDAAGAGEKVWRGTLADKVPTCELPGLFIVGAAAAHAWRPAGEFAGRRVLSTCSEAVQAKAQLAIEDRGGRPIRWPLIQLMSRQHLFTRCQVSDYDAIVLTSPSAVRIFFDHFVGDRRRLREFFTCGAGTDAELRKYGVASDVLPHGDYSAAGLIAEIRKLDLTGRHVLRLRSAKAGKAVAKALEEVGAKVDDVVLYDNLPVCHEEPLPQFDDVFFASASAVEVFLAHYGEAKLRGRRILVMGKPTLAAVPEKFHAKCKIFAV